MRIDTAETIAYLGSEGSYSHQAAAALFPQAAAKRPYKSFAEAIASVNAGEADVAVVPVENSIAGRVAEVHSLLLSTNLQIACEHLLAVEHCLIVGGGPTQIDKIDLGKIEKVFSHPQALAQCRSFLDRHLPNAERISTADTATAVRDVCQRGTQTEAAIGSPSAARLFKGLVAMERIADMQHNYTRFLGLTREDNLEGEEAPDDLTTLIFQVGHKPGALVEALKVFESYGINLTKLETYMVSGDITHPTFYVDVGQGLQDPTFQDAMNALKDKVIFVKLLGTYRASARRTAQTGFLPTR